MKSLAVPAITWLLITVSTVSTAQADQLLRSVPAGIDFIHDSGREGQLWTVEINGSGAGVLDFDNDGLLDIWIVQGGPLRDRSGSLPADRLYRNVSDENGLRFEDVSDRLNPPPTQYGLGIATGDIDNDQDLDVFLLNFGANQLYENRNGQFFDITPQSEIQDDAWSISATMSDVNHDGMLDIYIANYLEFPAFDDYVPCRRLSTRRSYCAPSNFPPQPDQLLINQGNNTFKDSSIFAGIATLVQPGMGVVSLDLNADSLRDIYVANDMGENFQWINQGDGTFVDQALAIGSAVNRDGRREASMGIAVADYDNDDDPDIFLTHDIKESNTLYVQRNPDWYEDQTISAGLAVSSYPMTGFGTGWIDVDLDSDLDLFIVNGAVTMIESQVAAGIEVPLQQHNQLLLNDGKGRFEIAGKNAIPADQLVSRGAAFADLDNDGDVDIVVTNNDGPALIYENLANTESVSRNWIGFELIDRHHGNTVGATVYLSGHVKRQMTSRTDGSYASANDARILFGLGDEHRLFEVVIRWADGKTTHHTSLKPNQYHQIIRPFRA